MAAPDGLKTWSEIKVGNNNSDMGRIAIYIDPVEAEDHYVLDISVWFWSKNPLFSNQHILKINGEDKEILEINNKNTGWNPDNQTLIYYDNVTIYKTINKRTISYNVELSNVSNFNNIIFTHKEQIEFNPLEQFIVNYKESFESTNEETSLRQIKYYGLAISLESNSNAITKEGYDVIGWQSNNNQYALGELYKENNSLTLVPIYKEKKYKIILNANGGQFDEGLETKEIERNYSSGPYSLNNETKPLRHNYVCKGWSYSTSDMAETVASVSATQDIYLYAIWEPKTVSISYNVLGNMDSKQININVIPKINNETFPFYNVKVSNIVPTVEKFYVFSHWIGSDKKSYLPGQIIETDQDIVLTAKWYSAESQDAYEYKVEYFHSQSGTLLSSSLFTKDKGVVQQINDYVQWSVMKNNTNKNGGEYAVGETLPNKDIKLYSVSSIIADIIYHYQPEGEEDKTFLDSIILYNDNYNYSNYFIKYSRLSYYVDESGQSNYFHHWEDENGQKYYPGLSYNIQVPNNSSENSPTFHLQAKFSNQPNNYHYYYMRKNDKNKIDFVAEDFKELNLESNNHSITIINENGQEITYNGNGYQFFVQEDNKAILQAVQLNEVDNDFGFINSIENENIKGHVFFNNFIQEEQLQEILLAAQTEKQGEEQANRYIGLTINDVNYGFIL